MADMGNLDLLMPVYDFSLPVDVARYLRSVPRTHTKMHSQFLRENVFKRSPPDFFDQVNAEYKRLSVESNEQPA